MNRLLTLMIIMSILFMGISTFAEDDTSPELQVTEVSNLQVDVVQIVIGLLTAFAAGGVIGIAGLAMFIDRIRNDVATMTALERLAESYPPGTRELLLNTSKSVSSIGELGQEVFDGVPIQDKSVPAPLAD